MNKYPETLVSRKPVRDSIRTSTEFKNSNYHWNKSKLHYREVIGSVMDTMRTHRPNSYEEWVEVYFSHCKTWEQLEAVGRRWAVIYGLTEQMGTAHAIIHAIDQTWEGYKGEAAAVELLHSKHKITGEIVREATANEDLDYGIDFIVTGTNGKPIYAVQVKPETYFRSHRIATEKERYKRNNMKFTTKYEAPVYYMSTADALRGELIFRNH